MPATVYSGIEAANASFMEAVRTGNEQRFIGLYCDDAILLLPGRAPASGSAAAQAFFTSFAARGVREIQLTTLEVEEFGDRAWERGSAESRGADGTILGKANYMVIWKRSASGWQIYRDILNASS